MEQLKNKDGLLRLPLVMIFIIHWILRIYLAYVLVPIGYKKLGVMVNEMKIIGYLVGPFEFFGPLLIILGALINSKFELIRIGSTMIIIIMVGAMYLHLFNWGHSFNDIIPAFHLFVISTYFLIRGK